MKIIFGIISFICFAALVILGVTGFESIPENALPSIAEAIHNNNVASIVKLIIVVAIELVSLMVYITYIKLMQTSVAEDEPNQIRLNKKSK